MILADKIIELRKKNGWSQEELAMQLGISRQSVSKWESAASIPDLDKIIKLSELFGVSTDYLLKDTIKTPTAPLPDNSWDSVYEEEKELHPVSLEEAQSYLALVQSARKKIALGVALCILSPILLILLGGLSEYGHIGLTEDMAGGIGIIVLLLMAAIAVALFLFHGMQLSKYEYLEKEPIALAYGVSGIVEKKKEEYANTFKIGITIGVTLCIVSVIPLFVAVAFSAGDFIYLCCVGILLALIALAVYLFVRVGMVQGSYQKLLQESEYTPERKRQNRKNGPIATAYWCIVTTIFLAISFLTGNWHTSWIIWPCAGVLFGAVCAILSIVRKKSNIPQ